MLKEVLVSFEVYLTVTGRLLLAARPYKQGKQVNKSKGSSKCTVIKSGVESSSIL